MKKPSNKEKSIRTYIAIAICLSLLSGNNSKAQSKNKESVNNTVEPSLTTKPMKGKLTKTSGFGMRGNPTSKAHEQKMHKGIDLDANKGDPIYACGDGTVIYSQFNEHGFGNAVRIDHGNGLVTKYSHMDKLPIVKVKDQVKAGDQVGVAGKTGNVTGVHLHLTVEKNGVPIDPEIAIPFLLS